MIEAILYPCAGCSIKCESIISSYIAISLTILTLIVRYMEYWRHHQCPATCPARLHLHVGWHSVLLLAAAYRPTYLGKRPLRACGCRQHRNDYYGRDQS